MRSFVAGARGRAGSGARGWAGSSAASSGSVVSWATNWPAGPPAPWRPSRPPPADRSRSRCAGRQSLCPFRAQLGQLRRDPLVRTPSIAGAKDGGLVDHQCCHELRDLADLQQRQRSRQSRTSTLACVTCRDADAGETRRASPTCSGTPRRAVRASKPSARLAASCDTANASITRNCAAVVAAFNRSNSAITSIRAASSSTVAGNSASGSALHTPAETDNCQGNARDGNDRSYDSPQSVVRHGAAAHVSEPLKSPDDPDSNGEHPHPAEHTPSHAADPSPVTLTTSAADPAASLRLRQRQGAASLGDVVQAVRWPRGLAQGRTITATS